MTALSRYALLLAITLLAACGKPGDPGSAAAAAATPAAEPPPRAGSCLLFAEQPIASRLRYYGRFGPGAQGARQQCEQKLAGRWLPGQGVG